MKRHWFLPATPDVLATLLRQADTTVAGVTAFARWAHGDASAEAEVREREHEADRVRRELARQVREAFSTPLDQEDLYRLSELMDGVLNGVKNVVREADALALVPDPALAGMADRLVDGVTALREACAHLTDDDDRATSAADAAIVAQRRMEKLYRAAMRDLLAETELRQVVAWQELYRRVLDVGERLSAVAERVWYAVVKEA